MFEIFGAIVEAIAGYLGGQASAGKISAKKASIGIGSAFFAVYLLYEMFFSTTDFNIAVIATWLALSIAAGLFSYILLILSKRYYANKQATKQRHGQTN